MTHRIHIFGASGSGTTTLGKALSQRLGCNHFDTDFYYWYETNPPFTDKRSPEERVERILADIDNLDDWILSGSLCGWGDSLIPHFNLAVFLRLDPALRMTRLREREALRYGARIVPGGDMRQLHLEFLEWAKSYDSAKAPVRSLDLHSRWITQLGCPVVELDSANDVEQLCDQVLRSC